LATPSRRAQPARNGRSALDLPILFMSHRRDGCPNADPNISFDNFKKVRRLNNAATSFVFIETGGPENRNYCRSAHQRIAL
jgi:hypothetical protein